jgi:5-hydroxyisourate hydrolase-like protein (transthyretin family)
MSILFAVGATIATATSLSGVVTDKAGAPMSNALIVLYSAERDWRTNSVDGRFSFNDVPEGRYALETTRRGFQTLVLEELQISSSATQITLKMDVCNSDCGPGCEPRTISYENSGTGGAVRGVVDASLGAPLAGVSVELNAPQSNEALPAAVTNDKGEFEIHGLNPGKYELRASFPAYSSAALTGVRVLSQRIAVVRITMHPAGESMVCQ